MYKPDATGALVPCHIPADSGQSYPADCTFESPTGAFPVTATVPRMDIEPMDAGVWCPLNKIYIGNSTIAAPPPDFGGAFGPEFIVTDHNQYPSWGEKIYPFDPRPYTEFIEVQIEEPVYIVKVLLGQRRGASRDPIYLTPHTPRPASPATTGAPRPAPRRRLHRLGQDLERRQRGVVAAAVGGPRRRAGGGEDRRDAGVLQPEPNDLPPHFKSNKVRIEIDSDTISDWNYIDYVQVR